MLFGIDGEHDRLEWLKPMLRRWGHFIDDYCAAHEDLPYYYNERANVSVLAAAAWGPGSGALEEYSCRRHRDGDVSHGRADLYVYDQSNSATIEAKQLWWTPATKAEALRGLLLEANEQATTNRDSDVAVAAVFSTLMLPLDADVHAELDRAVAQMRSVGMHLIAWALPHANEPFEETNVCDGKVYQWPGVLLGLRVAHRGLGGR